MVLKIAVIGIGGAVLAIVTKQFKPEYSVFVLFSVCLFLIFYLTSNLSVIADFIDTLSGKIHVSSAYIKVLFKLLAIAYVCQISSSMCKDLGYQSISCQIETVGKTAILILSIPIINSLLETVEQLLG